MADTQKVNLILAGWQSIEASNADVEAVAGKYNRSRESSKFGLSLLFLFLLT
jgi:hypothetical protein